MTEHRHDDQFPQADDAHARTGRAPEGEPTEQIPTGTEQVPTGFERPQGQASSAVGSDFAGAPASASPRTPAAEPHEPAVMPAMGPLAGWEERPSPVATTR